MSFRCAALWLLAVPDLALACAGCRPAVLEQVFADGFAATLVALMAPLALVAVPALWPRRGAANARLHDHDTRRWSDRDA